MHIQTNVIFNSNHIRLVPYIAINKNELSHPQNKLIKCVNAFPILYMKQQSPTENKQFSPDYPARK